MKVAIYTCLTNGYDILRQPLYVEDGFDFLCFVGKGEKTSDYDGVWKIIEIPLTFDNAAIDSRYPKILPHEFLQDYDYSIWIDANIEIKGPTLYKAAREKIAAQAEYCGVSHPWRKSIYKETWKCAWLKLITPATAVRNMFRLLKGRMPFNYGLYENNLILRKHNSPSIIALDEMWWEDFMKAPKRDQTLLMYCLFRSGIPHQLLLSRGVNTRNCPDLEYHLHLKAPY